jgi:hypothetical protein
MIAPTHPRPRAIRRGATLLAVLLAAATLGGVTGCSDPDVQYDYDARVNVSGYRTYDWLAEPAGTPAPGGRFDNPIMNDRVFRAVEAALAAKGYHRSEDQAPDFLVHYYPVREPSRSQQVHLGLGFGFGPLGLGVGAPVGDPHRAAVGGIVLEIQDFRTRTLVWKATAPGALQGADDPQEADADVAAAVRAMLKRFPPGHS